MQQQIVIQQSNDFLLQHDDMHRQNTVQPHHAQLQQQEPVAEQQPLMMQPIPFRDTYSGLFFEAASKLPPGSASLTPREILALLQGEGSTLQAPAESASKPRKATEKPPKIPKKARRDAAAAPPVERLKWSLKQSMALVEINEGLMQEHHLGQRLTKIQRLAECATRMQQQGQGQFTAEQCGNKLNEVNRNYRKIFDAQSKLSGTDDLWKMSREERSQSPLQCPIMPLSIEMFEHMGRHCGDHLMNCPRQINCGRKRARRDTDMQEDEESGEDGGDKGGEAAALSGDGAHGGGMGLEEAGSGGGGGAPVPQPPSGIAPVAAPPRFGGEGVAGGRGRQAGGEGGRGLPPPAYGGGAAGRGGGATIFSGAPGGGAGKSGGGGGGTAGKGGGGGGSAGRQGVGDGQHGGDGGSPSASDATNGGRFQVLSSLKRKSPGQADDALVGMMSIFAESMKAERDERRLMWMAEREERKLEQQMMQERQERQQQQHDLMMMALIAKVMGAEPGRGSGVGS